MSSIFDRIPQVDVRDGASRITVHVPRPGLAISRIEGHFSTEFARAFEEVCSSEMKRGGFVGIHDWTLATSFDLAVPPRLATWSVANLGSIRRIVIATVHPIVSLAVRTTNLTIKRIEHLDSAERVLAVIEEELRPVSVPPARR